MSGRKLLIVAAAGAGAWWFLRRTAGVVVPGGGAAAAVTLSSAHDVIQPTISDPGPVLPGLGPFYNAAKPIADNITTPLIHKINSTVGGVDPTAGLKKNKNGTYTDGLGSTLTLNSDGTVHRQNPPWQQTNGGKVIVAVGHAFASGGRAVEHFIGGLL